MSAEIDRPAIEAKVLDVIEEVLSLDERPTDTKLDLAADLEADSLDRFSLLIAIEDEFGGSIGEDEAEVLQTIDDIVNCIETKMRDAAS